MISGQPEREIRKDILDWLNSYPLHGVAWIHKSSASKSGGTFFKRGKYDRDYVADIEGIWQRSPLYIEVKAPGASPQKARLKGQIEFLKEMAGRGAVTLFAYSLADVIGFLGDFNDRSGQCRICPDPTKPSPLDK